MEIEWDEEKNEKLKRERKVSFEQASEAIMNGEFIGPEENPARDGQKIIIVRIGGYPCVVPLVEEENGDWFLKTIYQSRKMKRRFEDES